MNHSCASENHGLQGVCQRIVLEFIFPEEILLLDIFMERDFWFKHFQKKINIYKSNKTPQQKDSKSNSRAICPCQESLGQQELGEEQWITAAPTEQEQGTGKGKRPDCKEKIGLEQLIPCQKSC